MTKVYHYCSVSQVVTGSTINNDGTIVITSEGTKEDAMSLRDFIVESISKETGIDESKITLTSLTILHEGEDDDYA